MHIQPYHVHLDPGQHYRIQAVGSDLAAQHASLVHTHLYLCVCTRCNENELLICKVLVYAISSREIVKLIAHVVTSE